MELGLRGRKALVTARHVASAAPAPRSWRKKGATSCWCRAPPPILRRPRQKSPRSKISQCAAFHSISQTARASTSSPRNVPRPISSSTTPEPSRAATSPKWTRLAGRTAWDLKAFGYVNMTRRFCALMAARKKGSSSTSSALSAKAYSRTTGSSGNASLMAFTRAMGGTAPRDGLRVVGINPGPVETDRMTTRLRREAQAQFGDGERWREPTKGMTFGRAATPQEIAWMAAFLASDKSVYTTDKIITVDGGGTSRRSAL